MGHSRLWQPSSPGSAPTPPQAQPIRPGSRAAPGFGHHSGVFGSRNTMGDGSFGCAGLPGRHGQGVLAGSVPVRERPGPPVTQPAVAEAEVG